MYYVAVFDTSGVYPGAAHASGRRDGAGATESRRQNSEWSHQRHRPHHGSGFRLRGPAHAKARPGDGRRRPPQRALRVTGTRAHRRWLTPAAPARAGGCPTRAGPIPRERRRPPRSAASGLAPRSPYPRPVPYRRWRGRLRSTWLRLRGTGVRSSDHRRGG